MRVAVVGAGAIGGYVGGMLAHGGTETRLDRVRGARRHGSRRRAADDGGRRRVQGPPARDRRPRGEGARGHRASQAEGVAGDAFTLGEPGTDNDQRRAPFAEALADAGIGPRVVEDIRAQAWRKLMGNAVFNPLSVLTRATLAEIGRTSSTRSLAAALVEDVLAVALALGRTPPISIGGRVAGTERVGDHRTPMLQDLQAGKKLELDPLTSAVIELARLCRRGHAEAPDAPRSN